MGGVEGDPNPFGYQNQINDFVIDNEEFEEVPGYNFIDAPSSLGSRLKNLQYFNNPRTGFIDNTILSKGNPDNSLINRTTNAFGNFRDAIGGGITSILDNTIMGKLMAGFDATNPRAFNYNPALQGQIDFMRSPDAAKLGISYGTNPNTGLNQIIGGELKGKNLQSMFGSNDLMAMYDKELARAIKNDSCLSTSQIARRGWKNLWTNELVQRHRLYQFGLQRLMSFDEELLRSFFDTFFKLPTKDWYGYLTNTLPLPRLFIVMLKLFYIAPSKVRFGMIGLITKKKKNN